MNMDIIAVDTSTLTVYDFLGDVESEQELLQRAYNSNARNMAHYEAIIAEKPESDSDGFFTKQLENAKKREYKVVTWNEYETLKRKRYIVDGEIKEVTAEQFNNALDVLPPLKWCTIDGIEMFCISEMTDGTYTAQYARTPDGKYYCATVDVMDKSTLIYSECFI